MHGRFLILGHRMIVQPALGYEFQETNRVKCEQCTLYCPVVVITEKSQFKEVVNVL
jgi:Pyruvate/2-oxoacid:ferredoxin oxidoreductase delta subunit